MNVIHAHRSNAMLAWALLLGAASVSAGCSSAATSDGPTARSGGSGDAGKSMSGGSAGKSSGNAGASTAGSAAGGQPSGTGGIGGSTSVGGSMAGGTTGSGGSSAGNPGSGGKEEAGAAGKVGEGGGGGVAQGGAAGGGSEDLCAARHQGALITFTDGPETMSVWITDAAFITEAKRLLQASEERIPVFSKLLDGRDCDPQWTWHPDPSACSFADITIEACQGRFSDVEGDKSYWFNTQKQFCALGSKVTAVREQP